MWFIVVEPTSSGKSATGAGLRRNITSFSTIFVVDLRLESLCLLAGLSSALEVQPGLLVEPAQFGRYLIAVLPDGAYALPPGNILDVRLRRAVPADTIVLFGTGFGPVDPATPDGRLASAPDRLEAAVQVDFYSVTQPISPATVTYAGLVPGCLGLYQFNILVPAMKPDDDVRLEMRINGLPVDQFLQIAIGR